MASRFSSWYRTNKYPWESYDEARSRYELLYGPVKKASKAPPKNEKLEVKDYDMQQKPIRKSTLNERLGRTGVPRQEESGFLDDALGVAGSVTPDFLKDLCNCFETSTSSSGTRFGINSTIVTSTPIAL